MTKKSYPGPFFDWVITPIIIVGSVLAVVGIVRGWF